MAINVPQLVIDNVIPFLGVVVAFLMLRSEHRRERRIEREAQNRRHEANLEALEKIRLEIAHMKHLDECMDEVKEEIKNLREALSKKVDKNERWKR